MKSYGDMVISTPGPAPDAMGLLFRQCYETWQALGTPALRNIWFKEWPSDMGCAWIDDFSDSGHGPEPHHHYAWKFTTVE